LGRSECGREQECESENARHREYWTSHNGHLFPAGPPVASAGKDFSIKRGVCWLFVGYSDTADLVNWGEIAIAFVIPGRGVFQNWKCNGLIASPVAQGSSDE
jgi:hypothetical protein